MVFPRAQHRTDYLYLRNIISHIIYDGISYYVSYLGLARCEYNSYRRGAGALYSSDRSHNAAMELMIQGAVEIRSRYDNCDAANQQGSLILTDMMEGDDNHGRAPVVSSVCKYRSGAPPLLRGGRDHGFPTDMDGLF